MQVLMFGWEFPPFNKGGLGTACHGLSHGLIKHGTTINFVLPKIPSIPKSTNNISIINAESFSTNSNSKINFTPIKSLLLPYGGEKDYSNTYNELIILNNKTSTDTKESQDLYGKNLYQEVHRFAQKAYDIAKHTPHDIIHTHDWMTYPAGEIAKKASNQPLITHIHATEFDRTGDNPNQTIYDLERRGLETSDHIIAVSEYTKNKIIKNYGISPHKITVVHNAVHRFNNYLNKKTQPRLKNNDKIVLFLGRLTIQKGPDYFIKMAAKVLEKFKKVKFVISGSGDMMEYIIHETAKLGIAQYFLFTGFIRGSDIDRVYQSADLYVMPSVSEPFGITPLEAIKNGTPVLISKQSGVSEVIKNALKVDFWDIDEMANKVLSILHYQPLNATLIKNSQTELSHLSWKKQAHKIKKVYLSAINKQKSQK